MSRKLWAICLAIWMLLYAFSTLTNIQVVFMGVIMGVVALLVAVFLFLDK